MAYTLSIAIALGTSQTGLTLQAQIVDTTGANVGTPISSGFWEAGFGNYLWTGSIPDGQRGGIKFLSGATLKAFTALNPQEGEYLDARVSTRADGANYTTARAAKLDLLGNGLVSVAAPVALSGDVTLYKGDDYYAADDAALEWTDANARWPDLTGATATFLVRSPSGSVFSKAATIVTPSGTGKKIRVELTAGETALLVSYPGPSDVRVRVTLASGHSRTLIQGELTAEEAIA